MSLAFSPSVEKLPLTGLLVCLSAANSDTRHTVVAWVINVGKKQLMKTEKSDNHLESDHCLVLTYNWNGKSGQ